MESAVNELVTRERSLNSLSMVTLGVALAVVTMTFGALIVVFLVRAVSGGPWSHIHLPGILWLSSAVLVASSIVFELGRRKLSAGDTDRFHHFTLWSMMLGIVFLLCQFTAGFEIVTTGVVMRDNPHPFFIFLFGGLHGLHIIAGLIGLFVLYWRTRERVSGPRYQMATRVVAHSVGIFWHYLDGMWLLLFALLIFYRP